MSLFSSLFQQTKLEQTNQFEKSIKVPKYLADIEWYQDSNQSILTINHRYDLKHFSQHESATIEHVIEIVNKNYPLKLRSIGLANESSIIKYKPRYVLWEILIQLYSESFNPVDEFACAIAYESKGALYRRNALNKFEKCIKYISPEFMQQFISFSPLCIYMMLSRLYEKEHEYDSAILYTKLAKNYSNMDNTNFDKRINELLKTQSRNPRKRKYNPSKETLEFESDIKSAAKYFITKYHLV